MIRLSASQARQDFLKILNRVFAGEEFLVTKNKLVIAKISPARQESRPVRRKIYKGAFGMWKDRKDWNGLSTVEIADKLREEALYGKYGNR